MNRPSCNPLLLLPIGLHLVALSGCENTAEEFTTSDQSPAAEAGEPMASADLPDLVSLTSPNLATEWQVGALEHPAQEVFGTIEDISLAPEGRLLVLDALNHAIRVFGPDGTFLFEAGAAGQGPGELASPVALTTDSSGTVYVADRRLKRLSTFQLSDSALVFVDSFRFDIDVTDICILEDQLYMQSGWNYGTEGGVIFGFSLSGELQEVFGAPADTENPAIRGTLSEGRIACVEEVPAIVFLPHLLPEVRAYSPEGDLLWTTTIRGYRKTPVEEVPGGASFDFFPADGAHAGLGIVPLPDARLLVQLALRDSSATSGWDFEEIVTYTYSADTGTPLARSASVPAVNAFEFPHIFSVRQLPYPRITRYRIPEE